MIDQLFLLMTNDPRDFVSQIPKNFLDMAMEIKERTGLDHVVTLVFSDFVSNSTLVIARAFIDYLKSHGILCRVVNSGKSIGYAQRINFFDDFTNSEYPYQKHPEQGRFMEIELITRGDMRKAKDKFTRNIHEFADREDVFISDEALELLNYSIGELIDNVRRHSMSTGRISFQYYKGQGINEITVCDCGIGIIKALRSAGYLGKDHEILKLSVQKGVTSSTSYGPYEEQSPGYGLYILSQIAERNPGAKLTIATGKHIMTITNEYPLMNPSITYHKGFFPGTIVVLRIPNRIEKELRDILQEAWNEDEVLL